jgi:1L-myo-inositol 1-phosphate cytidylyltransferase
MISDAVILAAGKGSRLRSSDDDLPKPLYTVGGVPLIKRTILTLAAAGVTRVVVVTGFMADAISDTLLRDPTYGQQGIRIELAYNAEFDKSNGISVQVGGKAAGGAFMLSMADHIYSTGLARCVAACDLAAADLYLATDPRIGEVLDIDDATKVRSDRGRIVEIGKALTEYDRIDCGVFAVTPALLDALAEARAASSNDDCSLTDGVRRLAARGRARIVDIGPERWQDVDTPADRDHAQRAFADLDLLSSTKPAPVS